jgi:hypothetical protein
MLVSYHEWAYAPRCLLETCAIAASLLYHGRLTSLAAYASCLLSGCRAYSPLPLAEVLIERSSLRAIEVVHHVLPW